MHSVQFQQSYKLNCKTYCRIYFITCFSVKLLNLRQELLLLCSVQPCFTLLHHNQISFNVLNSSWYNLLFLFPFRLFFLNAAAFLHCSCLFVCQYSRTAVTPKDYDTKFVTIVIKLSQIETMVFESFPSFTYKPHVFILLWNIEIFHQNLFILVIFDLDSLGLLDLFCVLCRNYRENS